MHTAGPWDHLEPQQDQYAWGFMDRFVSAAEARGLKVSIQSMGTPDWVHPTLYQSVPNYSDRVWYPPRSSTELAHWRDFVHDLVARYGTRFVRYEMWNEPNLRDFWPSGPNPAEYAEFLRVSYLGANQANPAVTVTFGGLSSNDIGFLNATYNEIAKYPDSAANNNFFDELGVHPYSFVGSTQLSPDNTVNPNIHYTSTFGPQNLSFLGIEKMKTAMDAHGDFAKKLWLGEYGFSTVDTWTTAISDQHRALYLKRAYALASGLPYVSGLNWYAYYDDSSRGFNIIDRATLAETLTFRAFKQWTGAENTGVSVGLRRPLLR